VKNLFQFSRHTNQCRRKERGVLRRALRAVSQPEVYSRVLYPDDWFDYWHQHLDWRGLGDFSPRLRQIFLEGYARIFRHYALQAHRLGKPYQIWIMLQMDDAGYDAVYVHTPNPNPNSIFPVELTDVKWGEPELVKIFSVWLPEFSLVAGRTDKTYFIFADGYGIPLQTRASVLDCGGWG
jgi:hypothetical protein